MTLDRSLSTSFHEQIFHAKHTRRHLSFSLTDKHYGVFIHISHRYSHTKGLYYKHALANRALYTVGKTNSTWTNIQCLAKNTC